MKYLAILMLALVGVCSAQKVSYADLQALKDRVATLEQKVAVLEQKQAKDDQNAITFQQQIESLKQLIAGLQLQIDQIKASQTGGGTTPPPTEPPPATVSECTDGTAVTSGSVAGSIVLKTPGGKYCQQGGDILADFTALSVQASNVVFDCGGHKIIYGIKQPLTDYPQKDTNPDTGALEVRGNDRVFGFLGAACYRQTQPFGYDKNPCGGTFENFTLRNCTIVQAGGGPYSHGGRMGQGGGNGLKVENSTIITIGNSAEQIWTTYAGGHEVQGSTFIGKSTKCLNRHQMDCVGVKFSEAKDKKPNLFYNNKIIGNAQGGFLDSAPGGQAYKNTCTLNSYYTNDFCFYAWGPNQRVYQNKIDNAKAFADEAIGLTFDASGRGIQVNSPGISVFDNDILTRELKRNVEYAGAPSYGCEVGGTYGVQLESASNGVQVYGNRVTTIAGACDATAMRLSGGTTAQNVIANNVIRSLRESSTAPGKALGFTFRGCANCLVKDHSDFVVDTYCYNDVTQDTGEPATVVTLSFNKCTRGPTLSGDPKVSALPMTWHMDNYANTSTITGTNLEFIGMSGLDVLGYAIGTPTGKAHKKYDLYINGLKHIFNTDTQGVVTEDMAVQ